jgi:hypothetical protein
VLFEAAELKMEDFAPATPTRVPLVFADERAAWEGRVPEQPDQPIRVEAAAHAGRFVYFTLVGPWSVSARAPAAQPRFQVVISNLASLIVPGLMLAGAVLARRNVKLGRGDRRGALAAGTVLFGLSLAAWLLGASHLGAPARVVPRLFGAIGMALFDAGLMWVTYLGLEPYVRRASPDSLIGWTRLLGGQWRDARVGTDVLIGISAGLAMTLLYAGHHVLPTLVGQPEPMPIVGGRALMGVRFVLSGIIASAAAALTNAMLAVVGIVALLMLLKRRWLAGAIGAVIYTPVVISGMFPPGTPRLDLAVGAGIITILMVVILRFGLLASVAALVTHFVLLRSPLTTDFTSWRGPVGLWYVGVIAALGLGACYIARTGSLAAAPGMVRRPQSFAG